MDINAKQATALLAVLDTGSFEKAAGRLHLTASAVSQRIRALESQFGKPLVELDLSKLPEGMPKDIFRSLKKVRVAGQELRISRVDRPARQH